MKRIEANTRDAWRLWLSDNHLKETRVELLVYKKHTGRPSLSHQEAMHDAICFGWIDTILKRIDEDTYVRRFARRTDTSKWSDNTLRYAKQLLSEGKMAPEGIRRYKEGLSKPTHDHGIPKNPQIPSSLKRALEQEGLLKQFQAFSPSVRRTYLRWLARAKQVETQHKRIERIVSHTREKRTRLL
ncbi:MAG: YdeI/OmpD-associated family protein [Nanoarchaeota archaeon]